MVLENNLPEHLPSPEITHIDSSGYHAIYAVARRLLSEKYGYLIDTLIQILLDESDTRSYEALANDLIPHECEINIKVAIKIIHLAAQAAASTYNSSASDNQPIIDLDSRTSRVKSAANVTRQSGKVMLEAMGRQPFEYEEICYIVSLMTNVVFQWDSGRNLGSPNWNRISIEVNNLFGTNRSAKSIADQMKTMKYSGDPRLENAYTDLEDVLEDGTFYMELFIQGIIIEKELYERYAREIALILNDLNDLRSYWEIVRDLMPEEFKYGEAAANQIISMLVDFIKFDASIEFSTKIFEQRKVCINVNRNRRNGLSNQMLENQGAVRFSRDEFSRFMELRRMYIRNEGPQIGRTNYDLVARVLNDEFHSGDELRTGEKLSSIVRAYRQNHKKKPYLYPCMDDAEVPVEVIVQAYFPIELQEQ